MNITVNFIFLERVIDPVNIQCNSNEKIEEILNKFGNKIQLNSKDFEYYYKGEKINKNVTLNEITNNGNTKIIDISVKKKSKIMKCFQCDCNNGVIQVENYKLHFSQCRHDHECIKTFSEYEDTQRINYDKIKCSNNKCGKTQKTDLRDFCKCLNCSKVLGFAIYYCKDCCEKGNRRKGCNMSHRMIDYNEKYYYCPEHFTEFKSYCVDCNSNLCDSCEKEHKSKNHAIKKFDVMTPNIKYIQKQVKEIREKTDNLILIVDELKNILDGAVKMFEDYCKISTDLLVKYESYNENLKNFQVLKTMDYLSKSNKEMINDLNEIIDMKNKDQEKIWIGKCCVLIDIFHGNKKIYRQNPFFSKEIDSKGEIQDNNTTEESKSINTENGKEENNNEIKVSQGGGKKHRVNKSKGKKK